MKSTIFRFNLSLSRQLIYCRFQSIHHHNSIKYRYIYPSTVYCSQHVKYWNHLTYRNFTVSHCRYDLKDSSKVEQTVKALREEVKEKTAVAEQPQQQQPKPIVPKRSLTKRIWDEMVHYYHGFRLLFIDVGIASRLIWKILNGVTLSRREHKQLVRTSSDVFRLVPFSVFIIIPFMELLLPVFLKFFPGMLPSTFQTASSKVR